MQVNAYLYDMCSNDKCPCPAVFRLECKDASECPICKTPRFDSTGKPRQQLRYMPITGYLKDLLSNQDIIK